MDKKELTLKAGESYKFTVTHIPSNAKTSDIGWYIHDVIYDYNHDYSYDHKPDYYFAGPSLSDDRVITSERGCSLILSIVANKSNGETIGDQCKVRFIPSLEEIYEVKYYGFVIKDTSKLVVMGCNTVGENKDTTYLSGIKDEKLWIGRFNTFTKTQIDEFTDNKKIDLIRKKPLGYGDFRTYKICNTEILSFIEHGKGWISKMRIYDKTDYGAEDNIYMFYTDNQIKKYFRYASEEGDIIPWYNGSYMIHIDVNNENSTALFTCFDYKGNVIFTQSNFYLEEWCMFPTDYKNIIYFHKSVYNGIPCIRTSFLSMDNPNFPAWNINLFIPLSQDYKLVIKLLSIKKNIYTFKFDLTEVSGKQHSHIIEIDIQSGEYKEA